MKRGKRNKNPRAIRQPITFGENVHVTRAHILVSADSSNIQYPETVRSPGNTAGHRVPFGPPWTVIVWTLTFFFPRYPRPPRLRFNLQELFQ